MEYLGFIISKDGVSTDPAKIEAVKNWPLPKNVREVQGFFLGLTGWYSIFIPGYARIASPITSSLKKNKVFSWSQAAEEAFILLKEALIFYPILALPDFLKAFSRHNQRKRSVYRRSSEPRKKTHSI